MFLQNCFTGIKDKFAETGKNVEAGRIWDKPNSKKEKKVGRWVASPMGLGPSSEQPARDSGAGPPRPIEPGGR